MTDSNTRTSEHPVEPLFLDRWSPRAFTGDSMSREDLLTILDAAHWAPSAANSQPWRFVYALRDGEHWDRLFGLLNEYNQSWAKTASALVVIISKTHYSSPGAAEEKPSRSHSFDTGAAWGMLTLQAVQSGYFAHGMAGVHFDKANEALDIPQQGYNVEAVAAIGRLASPDTLPEPLRGREVPSTRVPLSTVAFDGRFSA